MGDGFFWMQIAEAADAAILEDRMMNEGHLLTYIYT